MPPRRAASDSTGELFFRDYANLLPPQTELESAELVPLPGPYGFRVHRRFVVSTDGPAEGVANLTVAVEMVGGTPKVRMVIAQVGPDDPPVDVSTIAALIDSATVDDAVRTEALMWSSPSPRFRADGTSRPAAVARAVHAAQHRRHVTPSLLADVLSTYEAEGIHAVMTKLNYSERNARRLLARARAELR
jgi:hypothetical protein